MAISAKKFVFTDPWDVKEVEVHYMVGRSEEEDYIMLEKDDMGGVDQISVQGARRLATNMERLAQWASGPGRLKVARLRKKERNGG